MLQRRAHLSSEARAVERRAHRRRGHTVIVAVLTEMPEHHVIAPMARDFARQPGRGAIAQVPETSGNASAHGGGVGARAEHPLVVVRLDYEDVQLPCASTHRVGHVTEVGEDTRPRSARVGRDDHPDGLRRVVRDSDGSDRHPREQD